MDCDTLNETEEKKSDYKPVAFEEVHLAPLVPPIGHGYMAFSDVLHWIVTKGGTVEVEPKFDNAWTNGLTELIGLVATGKLQVIGENVRTGMAEVIPHLNFASPLVASPFSLTDDERCDLVMSRKMILWLSRDELSQRPGDKWEHLRIDKEEIRDWWPIPEKKVDRGVGRPTEKDEIFVEFDRRKAAGQLRKRLSQTAEELTEWCSKNNIAIKQGSVENLIRVRFNAAKGEKPQN